jgi:hypothetical protein
MELFEQHQGTHILQSLDGFALALAADGRFLYISETVSIYLGLSQVSMSEKVFLSRAHHFLHAKDKFIGKLKYYIIRKIKRKHFQTISFHENYHK